MMMIIMIMSSSTHLPTELLLNHPVHLSQAQIHFNHHNNNNHRITIITTSDDNNNNRSIVLSPLLWLSSPYLSLSSSPPSPLLS